ncbi:MAG: hypothetical protein CM15mP49_00140 [Actinomycetota bacterium]|nr:MAG: hypothetical protein CM15mP49_00140 [Actinomycetota bacterium]
MAMMQQGKLADAINASGSAYVTPSVTDDVAYIRVSIGSTWTEQRHVEDLWDLIDRTLPKIDSSLYGKTNCSSHWC